MVQRSCPIAAHSYRFAVDVKNERSYASTPPIPRNGVTATVLEVGENAKLAVPMTGSVVTQTLASSHSANKIRLRCGINYKTSFNVKDTATSQKVTEFDKHIRVPNRTAHINTIPQIRTRKVLTGAALREIRNLELSLHRTARIYL